MAAARDMRMRTLASISNHWKTAPLRSHRQRDGRRVRAAMPLRRRLNATGNDRTFGCAAAWIAPRTRVRRRDRGQTKALANEGFC
ncbi:hypothetical protein [Lysobacter sp. yr284]|uniref:hypothetical protein n=1 Tax=Lysobacter sp. yr284 TaxID=1761791 RepID=UPI0011132DC3|nr:hypothetical protein [Lysobacter sp. yr284]